MSANDITIQAAETAIAEGHVLHVRANRLAGKRGKDRRSAQPAVDLTVGPDACGRFLVVDYAVIKSGAEERYETVAEAIRAVRRALTWDRIASLRTALVRIFGESEKAASNLVEDARMVGQGARMSNAFGHRPAIIGPLFGPSGRGSA